MIRILYTIPNFLTAGSGAALLNVVARLDRKVFEPAVCVLKMGGALERQLESLGVPLLEAPFVVGARPYASLPLRAWRAARAFRAYRFDLWHSFHYSDDYTEPLVAYLAGAKAWVYTKKNMSWRGRAWKVRSRLAKAIAAQNTRMLEEFFSRPELRRKTALIPPGVDTLRFRPAPAAAAGWRQRLGTPEGVKVAAAVGHLLPVKGHEALLEAARGVEGIEIWLAGAPQDPGQVKRLEELAGTPELSGRVRFLGQVKDVAGLHAEVDLFVHPTRAEGRQEGCPVALLEAMACGKACVATRVAGVEDVIEDGVSGLLVPARDAVSLRAAMIRVLGDESLRRRLEQGARRRILEHYSIEREVQQHEELYRRVLNGRRGR